MSKHEFDALGEDFSPVFSPAAGPRTAGASLAPGAPRVLFEVGMTPIVAGDQSYDAPDGRFFVIRNEGNSEESAVPPLVLVQNWFEELTRLVPND